VATTYDSRSTFFLAKRWVQRCPRCPATARRGSPLQRLPASRRPPGGQAKGV
jgi:hypothetical protein